MGGCFGGQSKKINHETENRPTTDTYSRYTPTDRLDPPSSLNRSERPTIEDHLGFSKVQTNNKGQSYRIGRFERSSEWDGSLRRENHQNTWPQIHGQKPRVRSSILATDLAQNVAINSSGMEHTARDSSKDPEFASHNDSTRQPHGYVGALQNEVNKRHTVNSDIPNHSQQQPVQPTHQIPYSYSSQEVPIPGQIVHISPNHNQRSNIASREHGGRLVQYGPIPPSASCASAGTRRERDLNHKTHSDPPTASLSASTVDSLHMGSNHNEQPKSAKKGEGRIMQHPKISTAGTLGEKDLNRKTHSHPPAAILNLSSVDSPHTGPGSSQSSNKPKSVKESLEKFGTWEKPNKTGTCLPLLTTISSSSNHAVYRFGEPDPAIEMKVVLLIGASGSGKTTILNTMANYVFGIKRSEKRRVRLDIDEYRLTGGEQKGRTLRLSCYELYHMPGFKCQHHLTIIDTPGFGGSSVLTSENDIQSVIQDILPNNYTRSNIDLVCCVIPSFLARLTAEQKSVFHTMKTLFREDVGDKMVLMLTFADCQEPQVLSAVEDSGLAYRQWFAINNAAALAKGKDQGKFEDMFWQQRTKCYAEIFAMLEGGHQSPHPGKQTTQF